MTRFPRKPSLAGTGLIERIRSTTFAMLGVVTAMALGLVALAANQGWPELPFSPIPGLGASHAEVGKATVVARPLVGPPPAPRSALGASGERRAPRPAQKSPAFSGASGSHQLVVAPSSPPPAIGDDQPRHEAAPEAAPAPSAVEGASNQAPAPALAPTASTPPAPAPTAKPAPSAPAGAGDEVDEDEDEGSGGGHGWGRGNGNGNHHGWHQAPAPVGEPATQPDDAVASDEPSVPADGAPESDDDDRGNGNGHGWGYGRGRSGR